MRVVQACTKMAQITHGLQHQHRSQHVVRSAIICAVAKHLTEYASLFPGSPYDRSLRVRSRSSEICRAKIDPGTVARCVSVNREQTAILRAHTSQGKRSDDIICYHGSKPLFCPAH